MHYHKTCRAIALLVVACAWSHAGVFAQEEAAVDEGELALLEDPIAILPFRERGKEVKDMGAQAADLLFAHLVVKPDLVLVDREDLSTSLAEQELNLTGLVDAQDAVKVGQLSGAKIIVTGSVMQVENSLYVVAKIIGTETTRVFGASAKGAAVDDLDALVMRLADDVAATIRKNSSRLAPPAKEAKDRIAALSKALGDAPRPRLSIRIDERHVGQATFDPAAETEMTLICRETGFEVVDSDRGNADSAKILIQGEGVCEFAARHGRLISVKARLEVKAIDSATNRVIAIDRQTCIAVDLTEELTGKQALAEASALIAERLLPKLVKKADAK